MNVSIEEVRRQTAVRQKRHRERVREALRNARSGHAPTPSMHTPLRLMVPVYDEDGEQTDGDYTDLEFAADHVMGAICREPRRGQEVSTYWSDPLIKLLEADPAAFLDYARRFVAAKVAAHQPKPKRGKRSVT
jgi:hypothetical protein